MYSLWYLKEYNPFYDRAYRHALMQPRKLMDTRVRRGETADVEQVVADKLLAKSTDIYFRVSRTHAEPKEAQLYYSRARSLEAKLADPNTYLQIDDPLRLDEVVTKRRYNWQTGKVEGASPDDINQYLRKRHLSPLEKDTFEWLQEINMALRRAGYIEAV